MERNHQADSSLHREVDLTKMGIGSDMERIKQHLQRLSFLSHHKLVKVSLNLTAFYEDWALFSDEEKSIQSTKIFQLLEILHDSDSSLKEISIGFDPSGFEHELLMYLLPFLIQELQTFSFLEKIVLEGPFTISFQIGNDQPGYKTISISANAKFEKGLFDPWDLMEEAQRFVGENEHENGFTKLIFPKWALVTFTEFKRTFEGISNSISSLKVLDLTLFKGMDQDLIQVDAEEIWEFCMKCSQLTSLSLVLCADNYNIAGVQILTIPDEIEREADLKRLDLELIDFQVDWKSMKKWIGKGLEEIRLVDPQAASIEFEDVAFSSTDIYQTFQYYGNTLKSIELEGVELEEKGIEEKGISFSNLTTLSITEITLSTIKFFTNSVTSNLKYLSLVDGYNSSDFYRRLPLQDGFDCLHDLLKKNQEKLISLSVFLVYTPHKEFTSGGLLTFTQLESLDVKGTTDKVQKWFSTNEYPNLLHLQADNDDLKPEFFRKGSKSLQQ